MKHLLKRESAEDNAIGYSGSFLASFIILYTELAALPGSRAHILDTSPTLLFLYSHGTPDAGRRAREHAGDRARRDRF